jgi:hypothetical protein
MEQAAMASGVAFLMGRRGIAYSGATSTSYEQLLPFSQRTTTAMYLATPDAPATP